MWEFDHKEGWALKNWCFWSLVLEKTLENPLDSKEMKPVNPKGNKLQLFVERIDVEAPILWPPDVESWLIWKGPDAWEIEGRRRRGQQRTRWLNGIMDSMDMSWWWTRRPDILQSMGSQSQTQLSNWTELNCDHFTARNMKFIFSLIYRHRLLL